MGRVQFYLKHTDEKMLIFEICQHFFFEVNNNVPNDARLYRKIVCKV